jgi:hypothetical protein
MSDCERPHQVRKKDDTALEESDEYWIFILIVFGDLSAQLLDLIGNLGFC